MPDGFLRSAELVAIEVEHLELLDNGGARLLIPASKTDQQGKDAYVFLGPPTVAALDKRLEAARIASGPIFIATHGRRSNIGLPITTRTVSNTVRILAHSAGLSGSFGSHSLRIGSAQKAAKAGASNAQLMAAGRWTNSTQAAHYARPARAEQKLTATLK